MAGRLPRSARLYGEIFINGTKFQMPYGSYVSARLFCLLLLFFFFNLYQFFLMRVKHTTAFMLATGFQCHLQ